MQSIKNFFSKAKQEKEHCIFCDISTNNREQFLYENDELYAIKDINAATAQHHILIITKQHIETSLDVKDTDLLIRMKQVGNKVLDKICVKTGEQEKKTYRFGFHLPPVNSVNHIHLHCFVEPISSWFYNRLIYGWLLNSVENVIEKVNVKNKSKI